MPDDDFNDIDELMSIDPLELSKQNLDRIIAYQRKQRALREAGVKTRKPKFEQPPGASLSELLASVPVPAAKTGGFRRR